MKTRLSPRSPRVIFSPAAEALEARIAPATLTGKVLTYTDADGDLVKVTFKTRGPLAEGNFTFDSAFASTSGQQLQLIDLSNDMNFDGASMTLSVTQAGGGNGRADLGALDASGVDLATVKLAGDLGRLRAGDQDKTAGLGRLEVQSLGARGTDTQAANGSLASTIVGPVGALNIAGDWDIASLDIQSSPTAAGKLGTLFIGGDLQGGTADFSGQLKVAGKVGTVLIVGELQGGDGLESGSILAAAGLGSLTVRGDFHGGSKTNSGWVDVIGTLGKLTLKSLHGGTAEASGLIGATAIKTILVQGDLEGGTQKNSGQIFSGGNTASVTITGNLQGGGGFASGFVDVEGALGKITVGGDVQGAGGEESGVIYVGGTLKSALIKGSLKSGAGPLSGGIDVGGSIGTLTVRGDIVGTAAAPVNISAIAGAKAGSTTIGKITVGSAKAGGDVSFAQILAGYDYLTASNGDAKIGTVTIFGDFLASSIVAGVEDVNHDGFGNADDALIGSGEDTVLATITSVVCKGTVNGSATLNDRFGITAEQIKSVKIGSQKVTLLSGAHNDAVFAVPGSTTGDFTINEVPVVVV